jgi:hypothetical protein
MTTIQPNSFPSREALARSLDFVDAAGKGDAGVLNIVLEHERRPIQEAMLHASRNIASDSANLATGSFDNQNRQMYAIAGLANFINSGMNIVNSIMDLLIRQDISYNQPVVPALVIEDAVTVNNFFTQDSGMQNRMVPLKLDANHIILNPNTYDEKNFKANPVLLSMAIGTLIRNALRAIIRENSTIDTESLKQKISIVSKIEGADDNQSLKIAIRDEAKPIPKDVQARMWESGFSASGSTGVGLYAAQNFIKALGGTIRYLDDPKQFIIEIPITSAEDRNWDFANIPENILIVNDHNGTLRSQKRSFEKLSSKYHFNTEGFSDDDELIQYLKQHNNLLNPNTLILLDYRGVDHRKVVDYLKLCPAKPVVLIGSNSPGDVDRKELSSINADSGVLNLDHIINFLYPSEELTWDILNDYSQLRSSQ